MRENFYILLINCTSLIILFTFMTFLSISLNDTALFIISLAVFIAFCFSNFYNYFEDEREELLK